jgi:hypothetical protein
MENNGSVSNIVRIRRRRIQERIQRLPLLLNVRHDCLHIGFFRLSDIGYCLYLGIGQSKSVLKA